MESYEHWDKKKTRKHNILFLNSGDTFYTKLAVKKINSYLKKNKTKY